MTVGAAWGTALLLAWVVDRFEPPWVVLVGDDGRLAEVPAASLPPRIEPGDRLATLRGPRIEAAAPRRAASSRRLAHLLAQGVTSDTRPTGGAPSLASLEAVRQLAAVRRPQDHYGRKAKREGFAARSVYKLEEIDRRVGLFRKGARVLDLGCAPGSWMQYAATAVGPRGRVVGVDARPVTVHLPPHAQAITADVFGVEAQVLRDAGGWYDVVQSDMAPFTSGNRFTDHMRSVELCRRALALALTVLREGGTFVCKVFEGEDVATLVGEIRPHFAELRRIKPKGTRAESVELYVVAQGRAPRASGAQPEPVGGEPGSEVP